jgi:copper resistance protein B
MSRIRSLVATCLLGSVVLPTAVTAEEMIADTTARKQALTSWGGAVRGARIPLQR